MTAWIAGALIYPGLVLLALAMERHAGQIRGQLPARRTVLACRTPGAALLAFALALCVQAAGVSVGIALWLGVITLAALGLGLVLAYAPALARPAAVVSLAAGLLGWLAGAA
ncbi:hypothetical protein GCM10023144_04510 [Pigmentiphaga soli]|uniref:DUF3325 domain-containing protein n=1 Tax=Pigmentiphaga soli TaxID=1007095 RepID=A0ABP8GGH7_9BURK